MNNWVNLIVLFVRPAISYLHIYITTKKTHSADIQIV